jgi:hypothetical protein
MKNSHKKALQFSTPPQEPAPTTIVVRIGNERFAIHWEIEDLPPEVAPLVLWKPWAKKVTAKAVKQSCLPQLERSRLAWR